MDVEPLTTKKTSLVIVGTPVVVWSWRYGGSSRVLTDLSFRESVNQVKRFDGWRRRTWSAYLCLEHQFPTPAHTQRKEPPFQRPLPQRR